MVIEGNWSLDKILEVLLEISKITHHDKMKIKLAN